MSENCRDIEPLLSPYLDGELDADARRRVEAHLASCDACRATLEEWRRADSALRAARPSRSDVEWERLAQRVEAAIDLEDEKGRAVAAAAAATGTRAAEPVRPARRWWLWGGSGALVAAALVALFWPLVVPHPTEPPTMRTTEGATDLGSVQRTETPALLVPPPSEPQVEESRSNAAGPAAEDARRGLNAPSTLAVRQMAVAPPEQKARADAATPPTSDAKKKAEASSLPTTSEAERAKESYGLTAGEVGRVEKATPPPAPAALSEDKAAATPSEPPSAPLSKAAAPATRRERSAAAEPMQAPGSASFKSMELTDRASVAAEESHVAAPDSSFVTTAAKSEAALADGRTHVLRDAASEVEAFLTAFPESPHRIDALAHHMRLLARLSALDPDQYCESARLAVDEWQQAVHEPPVELREVAQEIDERCGGWGD